MKTNLFQAYKQAPWRVQVQWMGFFLLALVGAAAVAGVYLSLSSRAAIVGRHNQDLEYEISKMELEINDMYTQLANISSARNMQERLEGLDMITLEPENALYLEVPGYQARSVIMLAPAPESASAAPVSILPEFTISLWDWLSEKVWALPADSSQNPDEVLP